MPATLSMWLGVTFVVLAVVATGLQAWLWGPTFWNAETKTTSAPKRWVALHRACGFAYAFIYVAMMWEMVPRLWEYQIELPARTIVHATAAIVIGVVLATKILIVRFFRHFEEAMPTLGFVLLVCTILLASLSLPFAFRAGGSDATSPENSARVERILAELSLGDSPTAAQLSTTQSLSDGREVVFRKCAACHDLRTILARPRTGRGWLSLCRRMQSKPTFGVPLSDADVLLATAYLIAITPGIQDDVRRRRAEDRERGEAASALDDEPISEDPMVSDAGFVDVDATSTPGVLGETTNGGQVDAGARDSVSPDGGVQIEPSPRVRPARRRVVARPPAPPNSDESLGSAPPADAGARASLGGVTIFERRCLDCHGAEEVRDYGGADRAGWTNVVRRMINEGAEVTSEEAVALVGWLARRHPPSGE